MTPLRSRLLRGFAANGLAQIVNLAIQVTSVPLFLHFWGKELFGEWLLLSTIPAYLAMSDLSFGTAAGNDMTMRVANDDHEGALEVYQATWILITITSLVFVLLGLVFVILTPWSSWLNFALLSHEQATGIAIVFLGQVCISQQVGLLWSGYRCDGFYARGITINNIQRLSEFAVMAVAVALGGGPFLAALLALAVRTLGFLLILLDLRLRVRWLRLGWKYARGQSLRGIISPALTFNAFPLGQALNLQGTLTVVGMLFGPVGASIYSTTRTLTRAVWQVTGVISNTTWVEMSTAFGKADLPLARSLHRRSFQLSFWIGIAGSLIMVLLGPRIYEFWTHGKLKLDMPLFYLLTGLGLISIMWSTSYVVPMAANRHQKLAGVFVVSIGLGLALSYVGGRLMGLSGIAYGLILAELLLAAFVLQSVLAMVGDSWVEFLTAVFRPPLWQKSRKSR